MMAEESVVQAPAAQVGRSRAVVICTAPRSSSYLMSEAIESVGSLGIPREYFDHDKGKEKWWVDKLGITGPADYIEKVITHGSTPNGVWGLKLHWYQVPDLIKRFVASPASQLQPRPDLTFVDCLRTRFTDINYVWLRRENKVAQAISWCRAMKTGVWHVRPKAGVPRATPNLEFDFDAIDRQVQEFVEADRGWYDFFRQHRIRALVVVFEQFLRDQASYTETMRQVVRYLGVDPDAVPIRAPAFRQQSDALSLEWEEAYRRRKAQLSRLSPTPNAAAGPTAAVPATPAVAPVARAPRSPAAGTPKVAAPAPAARGRIAAAGAAYTHRVVSERLAASPPHGGTDPKSAVEPTDESVPPAREPPVAADQIIAYDLNPFLGVRIVPGTQRREWMDATPNRFAYRCLPLVIANQYGWMLLCPARICATWNGEPGLDTIQIEYPPDEQRRFATSHFGSGILTFAVNYIFRTPPGINVHVRGPANHPKDGISALEGIIETDWSEATFTMNWKMTRPHHPVVFEKDEPFAMISLVDCAQIEQFHPEFRPISDNPVLKSGYDRWAASRFTFNRELKVPGSDARKQKWQRHYIKGETVSQKKADEHRTSIGIESFTDRRK